MKHIILALISFYRRFISPLTPPKCKYYPTCSCYAYKAVQRHGAVRGSALAVWRLLRCNPWSMGGIDYVPEKFTFRRQDNSNSYSDEDTDASDKKKDKY